jgi:response regulator of citrate/malate metabolism
MTHPESASTPVRTVLIVEDVDEMRALLEQLVGGTADFRVSGAARNAWEARLELGRRKPELVLLDEVLPGESSVDLLAEIRALGLPVILITGVEDAGHGIPAGAWGRLAKPTWETLEADRIRFQAAMIAALSG